MTTSPAIWFVTGTSKGLGLELVRQLLVRGDRVAATTRSADRLLAGLGDVPTADLLPLEVDLRDEAAVAAAVRATTDRFGGLDVVVNNAGYGFLAAVEETSDAEARAMIDVQLFGTWNVLRATLPILRAARRGHVVNVSSVLGLTAVPGWGLYCAGKFALEGMSEALAAELAEHDVRVTIVEPGYLRTSFLAPDSLALPTATAEGYDAVRAMTQQHLDLQGSQAGDPVRAATAIVDLVATGPGPLRRLLGSDAHAYATAKVQALQADLDANRDSASRTDYPAPA